jgi:CRISPR-associated protein Csc2
MLEQLTAILNSYENAFHTSIPRFRQNRFVQIVVLRETKSHAIFTTEGQTLDVERLQAGITSQTPIDRIVMYKRKQVAPERRTGKALIRDMNIFPPATKKERRSVCQIMGDSCGQCPDCILYGYAATQGAGSQRARVLTDSGFIVRSESQVMRNIKLNAIQETIAGGIAGSAFAGRENVLPQVFIPTVETLLDVTATEFIYALGNILKTTRYGAESNREGFIRNHILGIYFSDVEIFSNLELTQHYYDLLATPPTPEQLSGENMPPSIPDYLHLEQFTENWPRIEKTILTQTVGRVRKAELHEGLLEGIRELYRDEKLLRTMLQQLVREVSHYVQEVKGKDAAAEESN